MKPEVHLNYIKKKTVPVFTGTIMHSIAMTNFLMLYGKIITVYSNKAGNIYIYIYIYTHTHTQYIYIYIYI